MFRIAAILLTVSTFSFAAQAQGYQSYQDNFPYWYLGLNGQISFINDMDIESPVVGGSGEVGFDTGFAAGASIGYRPYHRNGFLGGARFEVEYGYRQNAFDSVTAPGFNGSLDGDLTGHSFMANVFYDFETGTNFTPYVGGGLGVMIWDFESNTVAIEDESTEFAYQAMLGFYYAPETIPDTEWGIGYRYFATDDPGFTTNAGIGLEHEFDSHNLEFLARFRF